MNEITVKSNIGSLEYNFDKLNQEVDDYLKTYQGLVITQDQLPDSKKLRAELNKNKKELNARKIAIKKEFIAPYSEFESKVKEVINKIDNVSSAIDEQIKAFEQEEKDNKYIEIKEYFKGFGISYINFDLIYNEKWLNKSVKTKDWQKAIMDKVQEVKLNLAIIDDHADAETLKPIFLKTLDLNQAYNELNSIKEQKKVLLENETSIALDTGKATVNEETGEIEEAEEEYLIREFRVTGTIKQLTKLSIYMKENNITFERTDNK